MLPSNRLRLIFSRVLQGIPYDDNPNFDAGDELQDYLLKTYIRETSTNDKLMELILSISSLGIASQEDWLRVKKIFLAHLPDLSCRTINKIFSLLVENDACGYVECVKIQDKLSQLDFSKSLRNHECLQTFRSINYVNSRLSPTFIPHALESIHKLVRESQAELLPILSYIIGNLLTSKENKSISTEVQYSIFNILLTRIESIDFMLLTHSELVYLLWSISVFCSSIENIKTLYLRASEVLITRGIQINEVKRSNPRDLLLLFCSLTPLLSLSSVKDVILPVKENGVITNLIDGDFTPKVFSKYFFKQIVETIDVVIFSILQQVTRGKLQNKDKILLILEMLTYSGATKVLKNAQILLHLLLRALIYEGRDAWFSNLKDFNISTEVELEKPLVNFYLFNEKIDILDILATRLSFSISPFVLPSGIESPSVREVIAILEALIYGNFSNSFQKFYLESCIAKLPRVIRSAAYADFNRIINSIMKLNINEYVIERAIHDRAQELGLKPTLIRKKNIQECTENQQEHHKPGKGILNNNLNSDEIALFICEKFLALSEQSIKDLPDLIKDLNNLNGINSITKKHCVSIIKLFSKHQFFIKKHELYQTVLTSFFRRVEMKLPVRIMLYLILDALKTEISRDILVDSLLWVGSKLIAGELEITESRDIAFYFIAAHELDVLDIAFYPNLIEFLYRKNFLESLSPYLISRLFAALIALGFDDRVILEKMLNILMKWLSNLTIKVEWTKEDWKAIFVLTHTLWSSSSEIVIEKMLEILQNLIANMVTRSNDKNNQEYLLPIATAVATIIIIYDIKGLLKNNMGKGLSNEIVSGFLKLIGLIFSEDGITLSLSHTSALLSNESTFNIVPQCSTIISLLISAHAVQRLGQTDNTSWKRLTSLGVSLWRYCLKHVEKNTTLNNALMTVVSFSIRFGASSQAFDRFMSSLIEKENKVNMLIVCSIADGLIQTGKRRSVATQFVAFFTQKYCLDDLPATALLSLLEFFTRDAEQVALGLARANMLITLVWSSLSLKMERLPRTKKLWKLVESVPVLSRISLLSLLSEGNLIDNSSVIELIRPVSCILSWEPDASISIAVTDFIRKLKISLDNRQNSKSNLDLNTGELQNMISGRIC